MSLTGTLRTWNDDRGYGFIAPTQGGAELFVHISAFPRDGSRPSEGERLIYELGQGKDGRPQATRVTRAAVARRSTAAPRTMSPPTRDTNWLGSIIAVAIVLAIGAYGYNAYQKSAHRMALERLPPQELGTGLERSSSAGRSCDGRTHCSQMTSCAEAKWFINNCTGMKMDGNHDGVPCEQQWCTGPFTQ